MSEVSEKRLASDQARKLKTMAKKAQEMADLWYEVDNYLKSQIEYVVHHCERVASELREFVEQVDDSHLDDD